MCDIISLNVKAKVLNINISNHTAHFKSDANDLQQKKRSLTKKNEKISNVTTVATVNTNSPQETGYSVQNVKHGSMNCVTIL